MAALCQIFAAVVLFVAALSQALPLAGSKPVGRVGRQGRQRLQLAEQTKREGAELLGKRGKHTMELFGKRSGSASRRPLETGEERRIVDAGEVDVYEFVVVNPFGYHWISPRPEVAEGNHEILGKLLIGRQ